MVAECLPSRPSARRPAALLIPPTASPPHNSTPPAAGLYGVAALVLLHFSGSLGEEVEGMLVGPLLMISAAVGALAAGMPMWMLPAPLLAASGLAMFYDTRSLRDYLLFVAGALATGAWVGWCECLAAGCCVWACVVARRGLRLCNAAVFGHCNWLHLAAAALLPCWRDSTASAAAPS